METAMAWSQGSSEADEALCFELYHENSKIGRRVRPYPLQRPAGIAGGELEGDQYPLFAVGDAPPLTTPIGEALGREPASPQIGRLSMKVLAALLAPQAAADAELIEVYFHLRAVDGLPPGLYRLGARGAARLIRRGDLSRQLAETLIDAEPARSTLQIAIAGAFARAAAASGERGYRLALMAAGARARAISLVAAGLGLGMAATADFYDRELDALLGLDGIDTGALILVAVGPAA
jgi:SagB-type dehydrogenase family enzyme